MQSKRNIVVGVFVVGGLLLFAAGLFLVGDRRMLFSDHFEVTAEFARVGGIQVGGKVRVAGMDAGEVLAIEMPPGPEGKFRIKMRIREDLHQVVRTDSTATIQSDGIVGNMFVQVDAGSAQQPEVPDGGTVTGKEPFDMADLMEQMSATVVNVNQTIVGLRGQIEGALTQVGETVGHADALIQEAGGDLKFMLRSGRDVVTNANLVVTDLRSGRGTIGKLMTDDVLHTQITGVASKADDTMENFRLLSEQARAALTDLQSSAAPVRSVAADLRETLSSAREVMGDLEENAEALKRNFLFRGFFNRRGYFDLNSLTTGEYRAGALEGKGRAALRIWLSAPVIFAVGPDGSEMLSEGGRARLDSAMAEFLRYPNDSPLMVEGYAPGTTRDARYVQASLRAALVREYVTSHFKLNPNRVGALPIIDEAVGSPAGDSWDGVAIALFAERAAIARVTRLSAVRDDAVSPGIGSAIEAPR